MFATPRVLTDNQVRSSTRISNLDVNKKLDEVTKKNRRTRQLDCLEQDNSHDDPHANIIWNKAAPKFDDEMIGGPVAKKMKKNKDEKNATTTNGEKARKRKLARPEFNKQRFKKAFSGHVAEQNKAILENPEPDYRRVRAYQMATAPSSEKPARKFCAVCGFISKYCCTRCGAKYCSLPCRDIHNDTRCMKWLA
uniref:HIT-type domain-containing protein n=1 Tax=Caenorhabditis japonica TaxID=281687 RepID=A0A8R1E125_CAEJA